MFNRVRSGIITLAVLGAIAVGASAIAGAASNSGTTGTTGSQGSSGSSNTARPPDPATLSHGPGETLVTGSTLNKVKQAALDKVSGATVHFVDDGLVQPPEPGLRRVPRPPRQVRSAADEIVTAFLHAPDMILRRGSTGPAVVALQKALGVAADGQFGPMTEAAVKAFQSRRNLPATGVVGATTWAALMGGLHVTPTHTSYSPLKPSK